ncbi:MAG: heavy metal translocating P-type ATPase, partial [Burkholderiales bacterium]|nr:heavy metal translocating P-type ATPase [Burkholderiales bacterium]
MEIELAISGMSCAACAARIEKVLNRMPHDTARVSFANESAWVTLKSDAVTAEDVIAQVKHAGFDARRQADPFEVTDEELQKEEAERQQALRRERKVLWICAVLCVPFIVQMIVMFCVNHDWMLPVFIQFLLALPIQILAGARFYRGAFNAVRNGAANMDVLVALGTTCAFGVSLIVWIFDLQSHVYFEASAMVLTLVLLGKYLEMRARVRAGDALKSLIQLQPSKVLRRREKENVTECVLLSEMRLGDLFLARAGESIPLDGVVVSGESLVNESMLTGESLPVLKKAGDKIFAGTINTGSALTCEATAIGQMTLLSGIVRQVKEAQASRAPISKLADQCIALFVPVVLVIGILTFIVNGIVLGDWVAALLRMTAVWVVACPCALGLATPSALVVGVGRAAQIGMLIKNAEALERAEKIDQMIFDKTGTLTKGAPKVVSVQMGAGVKESEVLEIASALELGVSHPLGQAIVNYAGERHIQAPPLLSAKQISGQGVAANFETSVWRVGSALFLRGEGVNVPNLPEDDASETVLMDVHVARDAQWLGRIRLTDAIRTTASDVIKALIASGITPCLLTGDSERAARRIGNKVGIHKVLSRQLPQDKRQYVQSLQGSGHVVAMVGDGVNDAPALAQADVSFAMGTGAGSALAAADITLLRNDLSLLIDARHLSHATFNKIRQNLFFAFLYN